MGGAHLNDLQQIFQAATNLRMEMEKLASYRGGGHEREISNAGR
jgi:hypothetical protein